MERKGRSELQQRYAAMADGELQDMLKEGKDAYTPEAFAVLLEECTRRGLEGTATQGPVVPAVDVVSVPPAEGQAQEQESFVTLMIIAHPADKEHIEQMFSQAGIRYFLSSMSLKGEELPAALVVEEPRCQEAVRMLEGYTATRSIALW